MTIFGVATPLTPGILVAVFFAALGFAVALRQNGRSMSGEGKQSSVPWLIAFSLLMAVAIIFLFG